MPSSPFDGNRVVYMRDVVPRPPILQAWDRFRNRYNVQCQWFAELFAESFGVFLFVYYGVGSAIGLVLGNILNKSLSSIFQLGWAYTFGVLFALTVCPPTSGGHFNPCITIAFTLLKGFPPLKGVRYITAQIFGAYIACLLVYNQWKVLIEEAEQVLSSQGMLESTLFTPNGPAGAFALYLLPGQEFGRSFLNEFVNCTVIGIIIWACLDPTSFLIPPALGPVLISMSYGAAIWSFLTPGIALNTARDVGGRLMALTIWGTKAAGGRYAAIAALTNIPATLLGAFLYEMFLGNPNRTVNPAHLQHIKHQLLNTRQMQTGEFTDSGADMASSQDKGSVEQVEITAMRVV